MQFRKALGSALLVLAAASAIACGDSNDAGATSTEGAATTTSAPVCALTQAPKTQALDCIESRGSAVCKAASTGNSWCKVTKVTAYSVADCTKGTPSITEIAALLDGPAVQRDHEPAPGTVKTRAELKETPLFAVNLTTLLEDSDAYAGSTKLTAMEFKEEASCNNCHDFSLRYVLFYAEKNVVIVIEGSNGYDS